MKFEHTTATDLPCFTAGRFGIVSASAGGRLCSSASLDRIRITDLFSANGATAAANNWSAWRSSPTTTTCVCGLKYQTAAIP